MRWVTRLASQKRLAGLEREKEMKRCKLDNRAKATAVIAVANQPELVWAAVV